MRLLFATVLLALLSTTHVFAQNQNPVCPFNYSTPSAVTASTQLVTAITGRSIRICKVIFNVVQGLSAVNFALVSGTGSACGTGTANLTQTFTGVASTTQAYDQSVDASIAWTAGTGVNLCLQLSGAPTGATVQVFYGVY